MNPLSTDEINKRSPYKVCYDYVSDSLYFVTDNNVQLVIDFMEDDLLHSAECYQFCINNANNMQSPRDINVQKTILVIIDEFFKKNMSALLYICETGDGKQKARSRLFASWFEAYEYSSAFTCMTTSLCDAEGVFNSATLIIPTAHPQYKKVLNEFTEASAILRDKPSD
mgnify:FL=1